MVKSIQTSCPKCSKAVKNTDKALQCEGDCDKWFHTACEGISDRLYKAMLDDDESAWTCSACSSAPQSQSQQSSLRYQFLKGGANANSSPTKQEKKAAKKATKINVEDLNPSVQELGNKINQLADAIDYFSSKYDEFFRVISEIKKDNKLIKKDLLSVKKANKRITKENETLKQRLNEMEQSALSGELEINGIPQAANENCENILQTICEKMNCPIEATDVVQVRRVGLGTSNTKPDKTAHRPSTTIVATLRNSSIRQKILDARKTAADLTLKDIGFGAADSPDRRMAGRFFLNERLSPTNRHLFWLARQAKKPAGYQYCWVKHGIIYMRRIDSAPPIRIKSESDIPTDPSSRRPAASSDEEDFDEASGGID